jgi:hypothetical protein
MLQEHLARDNVHNNEHIQAIYEQHIKPLPPSARLQLLALIAQELAAQPETLSEQPVHSIMELHGLGKNIWQGVDAQEYVNQLRETWDNVHNEA